MEIFQVRGKIQISEYMIDGYKYIHDTRLVRANDSKEAKKKFEMFWESKTDEYSIYYNVIDCFVDEVID